MVVLTRFYTKLTEGILTAKTSGTTDAPINLEHWAVNYGIPFGLLADNGPRFVRNFFVAGRSTFGVNIVTTTEYHAQTNHQEKSVN